MNSFKRKCAIWSIAVLCLSLSSLAAAWAGLTRDEKNELKHTHRVYEELKPEELPETIDIAEALLHGRLHNPGLEAAFYQWKASVHDIKQAKSLEDPQFSFKSFIKEVETRVGPQREMYSVGQMVPFPGKLYLQGRAATAVSRQKHADFIKTKLAVDYEIRDAFFEYWFLYKRILVTQENMSLLEHIEGVAQSKFKSGLESNQDLLKAQVELGKLENELLTLNDYRIPLAARFNAVLNREVTTPIGWPGEIDHKVFIIDKDELVQLFFEHNPDLKRAAERIEETKKKVWLARMDYLPDTMVTFDYINVDKRAGGPVDNGQDATALMFKVNVPLWQLKQKSQVDEAKAMRTSAEASEEQLRRDLAAKIAMVYFRLRDADRQIQLYRNALVPKAEQSLKASETGYTAGRVDFLNLIDSQRILLDFQLSYYRSIRDYEQRLAELEMMVGAELRSA